MECDKEKLTIPKLENGIFTEKGVWIHGCDYSKEVGGTYGKKTDILLTQVMIRQTIRLQKWIESKIMLQTYENFILWT